MPKAGACGGTTTVCGGAAGHCGGTDGTVFGAIEGSEFRASHVLSSSTGFVLNLFTTQGTTGTRIAPITSASPRPKTTFMESD